jgi:hypothetical protein
MMNSDFMGGGLCVMDAMLKAANDWSSPRTPQVAAFTDNLHTPA